MNLNDIAMLAADAAPASQPQTYQENPQARLVSTLGMFALMGVMFWLLLIRPQSKKAKEHAALLKTLRPGDRVETNSGIVGVVVSVKEKTVAIRSEDTKMEMLKGAIAVVTKRTGESEDKES
jgi:preprotein translocase subunit YajC